MAFKQDGDTATTDTLTRRKRLHIRCWRRGTREMDLILGGFADQALDSLPDAMLDRLESLLHENDHDIYAWISGTQPIPAEHQELVTRLKRTM